MKKQLGKKGEGKGEGGFLSKDTFHRGRGGGGESTFVADKVVRGGGKRKKKKRETRNVFVQICIYWEEKKGGGEGKGNGREGQTKARGKKGGREKSAAPEPPKYL